MENNYLLFLHIYLIFFHGDVVLVGWYDINWSLDCQSPVRCIGWFDLYIFVGLVVVHVDCSFFTFVCTFCSYLYWMVLPSPLCAIFSQYYWLSWFRQIYCNSPQKIMSTLYTDFITETTLTVKSGQKLLQEWLISVNVNRPRYDTTNEFIISTQLHNYTHIYIYIYHFEKS